MPTPNQAAVINWSCLVNLLLNQCALGTQQTEHHSNELVRTRWIFIVKDAWEQEVFIQRAIVNSYLARRLFAIQLDQLD